jgi:hypothetical protein
LNCQDRINLSISCLHHKQRRFFIVSNFDLATQHAADLTPYGETVGAARMQEVVERYRLTISKPMDTIGNRKQKTTSLRQLLATLDSVLYDQLDKLIVLFKQSHSDFYNEYKTARNLINTSARHRKTENNEVKE